MILRFLPHSPFVRKVLVVAHETGQADQLQIETAHVFDLTTPLLKENPLGKVPALVMEDGSTLYDSTVICEFLDARHDGPKFFPEAGPDRWTALRRNALGDGLGLAATAEIRESYRPENDRSDDYIAYYRRGIDRSLTVLEQEAASGSATFDIGDISVACALSYVDFRFAELDWRATCPALGQWYDALSTRPSMAATPLAPYEGGPMQPKA
jgi:glutathione S-transferase